jgi:hypothetical protein
MPRDETPNWIRTGKAFQSGAISRPWKRAIGPKARGCYYVKEHDVTKESWPKLERCLGLMTAVAPAYSFEDTFHASVRCMHWTTQKKILADLIDIYEDTLLNYGRA